MNTKILNDLNLFWKILNRSLKLRFLFLCVISTLSMLLEIISLGTLIPFLTLLLNPEMLSNIRLISEIETNFGIDIKDTDRITFTALYVITVLISASGRFYTLWVKEDLNSQVAIYLKKMCMQNILLLPNSSDLLVDTAYLMSMITNKLDIVVRSVFNPLVSTVSSFIFLFGLFITASYLMPVFLGMFIIGLLPVILIATIVTKSFLKFNGMIIAKRQTALTRITRGILANIREFFVAQGARFTIYQKYSQAVAELHIANRNNFLLIGSPRIILEAIVLCVISIALALLANDDLALPVLAAMILTIQKMLPHIQIIYQSNSTLHGSSEIFQESLPLLRTGLKESSLKFSYDQLVFNHSINIINRADTPTYDIRGQREITINRGENIAVVGRTGSGKSTLINCIMGLHERFDNAITVDGLRLVGEEMFGAWRATISYVPQKPLVFDGSVKENICFGTDITSDTDYHIAEIARLACIHDKIEELPYGYDTVLADDKVLLSGGEIQRLAVARALYQNRDVLFMDEITSSLDPSTARIMVHNILNRDPFKTNVFVTHAFELLPLFDRVFVVHDIGIVSEIRHDQIDQLPKLIT